MKNEDKISKVERDQSLKENKREKSMYKDQRVNKRKWWRDKLYFKQNCQEGFGSCSG